MGANALGDRVDESCRWRAALDRDGKTLGPHGAGWSVCRMDQMQHDLASPQAYVAKTDVRSIFPSLRVQPPGSVSPSASMSPRSASAAGWMT